MVVKKSTTHEFFGLDESKIKNELSCRGINCILIYIEENYGRAALEDLVTKTGMSLNYLQDQNNWVSWSYYCDLLEALVKWTGDPKASYKAGTYSGHKKSWGYLYYVFYAFGNVGKIIKKGVEILPHINKAAEWSLLSLQKNKCTFRIRMKDGQQAKRICCESRMGQAAGISRAFGMPLGKAQETQCQALGADSCICEVSWLNRPQKLYGFSGLLLGFILVLILNQGFFGDVVGLLESILILLFGYLGGSLLDYHLTEKENAQINQEQTNALEESVNVIETKYMELKRAHDGLFALHETSRTITSTLKIDEILNILIKMVVERLGFDRSMVMLIDEEQGILHRGQIYGDDTLKGFFEGLKVPLDENSPMAVAVLQKRQGRIVTRDFIEGDEATDLEKKIFEITRTKEYVIVPLVSKERLLGILAADNIRSEKKITEEEKVLMVSLANQVAMALENAGSFQTIEELNINLEKKVEERTRELKKSEEMYQDLYESAPDMYLNLDPSGVILNCNRTGLQILGYDKEEVLGRSIHDFLAEPSQGPKHLQEIFEKDKVEDVEISLLSKKNEVRIFHLNSSATLDPTGKLLMTRGVWRDITLKKKLEQQLIQAQKMESLGTLAGGIAHDFNNVLGGILGYASFIKDLPGVDETILPFLEIIEQSALRASELSNRILTFTRGSENRKIPVELHPLIEETCMLLGKRIEKNVVITKKLQPENISILGEGTQIQQVLMNICINACDAMPQGGNLTVETKEIIVKPNGAHDQIGLEAGEYVEVAVSDTGVGITPEIQGKIFDPFFTTKEVGKGTGLGLAMAYGLVKSHGGHIEVESRQDQGSCFRIFLPLCPAAPQKTVPVVFHTDEPYHEKENPTVLIVDDEEVIRNLAKNTLIREGFQIIFAENGEQACEIFEQKKEQIDLVILDMIMPVMDGKETYEVLHRLSPNMPVIFSTGYSKDDPRMTIPVEEIIGFVQKPYSIDMFLDEVRRVLALSKE